MVLDCISCFKPSEGITAEEIPIHVDCDIAHSTEVASRENPGVDVSSQVPACFHADVDVLAELMYPEIE